MFWPMLCCYLCEGEEAAGQVCLHLIGLSLHGGDHSRPSSYGAIAAPNRSGRNDSRQTLHHPQREDGGAAW